MCVCVIRWSQTHSMCTQWWMIWPGWVQNNWGLHRLALLKYFEKERPEIAHGRFNHQFVEFMEMIHGRFQWKEIKKWKCSGTIYYPFTGSWVPDLKCRNTAEKAVIFLPFSENRINSMWHIGYHVQCRQCPFSQYLFEITTLGRPWMASSQAIVWQIDRQMDRWCGDSQLSISLWGNNEVCQVWCTERHILEIQLRKSSVSTNNN